MKIIETLDEVARAVPHEERPWAREQKYLKELQERRENIDELHSIMNAPTMKYSAYTDVLRDLQSLVEADSNFQGEYSKELTCEALQFSIDVISWVFNMSYHLKGLNELHEKLHEESK